MGRKQLSCSCKEDKQKNYGFFQWNKGLDAVYKQLSNIQKQSYFSQDFPYLFGRRIN
jgi:hypothetical protein